jgi:conjugative transposon TraN protein
MKRILIILVVLASSFISIAQEKTKDNPEKSMPSTGDYFQGLTRPLTFDKMIAPYALEVTIAKTVHLIFPAAIRYVDLGSADLLAAKADGTENVLRVKAARKGFPGESNLSVITDDGSYYSFNVKYADEPVKLSVGMSDIIHSSGVGTSRGNNTDVFLEDLGGESPVLVNRIMQAIYKNNRREVKNIGCKQFGMHCTLKGIYSHNNLMYFHTELKNSSNVPFNVDYISFKIVDRKVAKRTAIQQQSVVPLRAYNQLMVIGGEKTERTVFALPRFTLPEGKQLLVELNEKDGGRYQSFTLKNDDLVHARGISKLKVDKTLYK